MRSVVTASPGSQIARARSASDTRRACTRGASRRARGPIRTGPAGAGDARPSARARASRAAPRELGRMRREKADASIPSIAASRAQQRGQIELPVAIRGHRLPQQRQATDPCPRRARRRQDARGRQAALAAAREGHHAVAAHPVAAAHHGEPAADPRSAADRDVGIGLLRVGAVAAAAGAPAAAVRAASGRRRGRRRDRPRAIEARAAPSRTAPGNRPARSSAPGGAA